MPTISMPNSKVTVDLNEKMKNFNEFLKKNQDFINSITPLNPTIPKDDEWNDPIYDEYANTGDD